MRLSSHTPSAASGGCARKARGVGNARHERKRTMKYRKKPVTIEAITFDELVDYGRVVAPENAAEHGGYAWHFSYKGHPLTHENVDCRSEEHTSELQSLMRISYAVFCLKKKTTITKQTNRHTETHII